MQPITTWRVVNADQQPIRLLEDLWRRVYHAKTVNDACMQAQFHTERNTSVACSVIATVRHAKRPTTDDYEVCYTYHQGKLVATSRVNLGVPDVVLDGQLDFDGNVYHPDLPVEEEVTSENLQACLF